MKQKLHPRAVYLFWFQFTRLWTGLGWVLIFGIIYSRTLRELGPDWNWNFGKGILFYAILQVILILATYIWARLFYELYFYELTEDALRIEKGVIWKKYISIPYERIQNVDIYRGLMARILRLSDLQIQTAGYSGAILTEGRLLGLLPEDAERIREDLIQRAKGTKQGV